jgi:outer membrane protein OmpA-like peptidoglycan-associated protein
MSLHNEVVPKRILATTVAIAFALCLLGSQAAAQVTIQPQAEIFGGYSWFHPNGYIGVFDNTVKAADIDKGFDVSGVYYLPSMWNLGVLVEGSGHFNKGQNPGGMDVGIGTMGLQYKYHTDTFSPFVRVFGGADRISPTLMANEWRANVGAGGGFDLSVGRRLSIRIFQADYIWSSYNPQGLRPWTHSSNWNSIRLSGGLVFNIGNYNLPPLSAACSANPGAVTEGDKVTVTTTGTNFNPKHALKYGWTATGGKLSGVDAATETVDTTGLAAGSYTANATITDPRGPKNANVANCGANFTVNAKPQNPPQVTCSANPTTVKAGDPSTITANATSPDNAQISGYSYTASAGRISGTGTTATLDTTGAQNGPISVTVTATDARGLTGTCTTNVNVENPPAPPQVTNIASIQFPDKKRPWRVDNTAKAILDDVASRLKADPNAKIAIVGYADGEKAPMVGTGKNRQPMDLAAQRAVNAKAYLVQQQGIDPSRVDVRKGTGKSETADIDWIPQGADAASAPILQGTTEVDESVVKPSTNAYPMPHKAAPMHHRAKPAAAPAAQ